MSQLLPETYLRLAQIVGDPKKNIAPIVPVSRATWWNWVASGKAPRPIKLSSRVTVWSAQSVRSFLSEMAALSTGQAA